MCTHYVYVYMSPKKFGPPNIKHLPTPLHGHEHKLAQCYIHIPSYYWRGSEATLSLSSCMYYSKYNISLWR